MYIEVYHGTVSSVIGNFLNGKDDLYGARFTGDPHHSGNLTNSYNSAEVAAFFAETFSPYPIVLTFNIPEEVLICEGPIGSDGNSILAYSTVLTVEPIKLPKDYLAQIGLPVEAAIAEVARGRTTYFRVPHEYLVRFDSLDSIFSGIDMGND